MVHPCWHPSNGHLHCPRALHTIPYGWSGFRFIQALPKWVKNLKRNMMLDEPYAYLDIDVAAKAKGLPK